MYYQINTYYLQITGTLYSITGCISSIIFYLIKDKIQFRILFILLSLLLSITLFIFPISFNYEIFFIIEILIISFILRGYNIIIDYHLMKVYGMENYFEISRIIRLYTAICEMFSAIFAFRLENNFSDDKNYIFKIMYIISGCFNLISLILGLFETDEKFNYDI